MEHAIDILRRTLGRRASSWEVCVVSTRTLSVQVQDGQVEALTEARTRGAALRTIVRTRPGFSYTFSMAPAALRAMADNALRASRANDPDPAAGFIDPGRWLPAPIITDTAAATIPRSEKIQLALDMEKAAAARSPRVIRVRKAAYAESSTEVSLYNSHDHFCVGSATAFSLSVMAVAAGRGDTQMGWESDSTHYLEDLDPVALGRAAADKAVSALGAKKISSLSCPVVVDRECVAELLGVLAPSISGDAVLKKKSRLAGQIGKKIFSPAISIVDDGTVEKGMGSFPFDGEGMPHSSTPVFTEGRLNGFLYDSPTARKARAQSTGNSLRPHLKSPPAIGPSNLILTPGHASPEDLVREAGSGVRIMELIGVHTADPVSGDFSFGATGCRIERGRLGAPLREMAVSGNIFTLLRRVALVGNDHRFYGPWGSASVLLERMSVSGR